MPHRLISYLSEWLRSNSTFFFSPSILGQLWQKESRICDKKVLWILSRTAGWHLSVLNGSLPLPSRQKKSPSTADLVIGSSTEQNMVLRSKSTEGSDTAELYWQVFHQKDIYCFPTEQHLPSAAVTSFSKTHKEQSQWQHFQNAWRGRGGGRNGLCRLSSAPVCQQGYWIPCLASPGCSSLPPLAATQTLLSWSTPLLLRFAFELCKLCTPQGFSAKR